MTKSHLTTSSGRGLRVPLDPGIGLQPPGIEHAHTQQQVIGGVVLVIALAHFIWAARIAEFNSQRQSLRISPTTVFGVRLLGVVLLLIGLLEVLT